MKRIILLLASILILNSCTGNQNQETAQQKESASIEVPTSEVSQSWDTNSVPVVISIEEATWAIQEENIIHDAMALGVNPGNQAMQTSFDESINQLFN